MILKLKWYDFYSTLNFNKQFKKHLNKTLTWQNILIITFTLQLFDFVYKIYDMKYFSPCINNCCWIQQQMKIIILMHFCLGWHLIWIKIYQSFSKHDNSQKFSNKTVQLQLNLVEKMLTVEQWKSETKQLFEQLRVTWSCHDELFSTDT